MNKETWVLIFFVLLESSIVINMSPAKLVFVDAFLKTSALGMTLVFMKRFFREIIPF
jgi:hypothetical protein